MGDAVGHNGEARTTDQAARGDVASIHLNGRSSLRLNLTRSDGRSPLSVPLVVVAHGCCVTCVCEVFEARSDFSILG